MTLANEESELPRICKEKCLIGKSVEGWRDGLVIARLPGVCFLGATRNETEIVWTSIIYFSG